MRTKDWRDGDVVFINSTCFDEVVMTKIGRLASEYIFLIGYRINID